jgi:hypothetical protein
VVTQLKSPSLFIFFLFLIFTWPGFQLIGIFATLLSIFYLDLYGRHRFGVPSVLLLPVVSSFFSGFIGLVFDVNPTLTIKIGFTLGTLFVLLFNNGVGTSQTNGLQIKVQKRFLIYLVPSFIFIFFASKQSTWLISRFMEGDSRNHALLIENIVENGYVTPSQQGYYPSGYLFMNAVGHNSNFVSSVVLNSVYGIITGFIVCTFSILVSLHKLSNFLELKNYQSIVVSVSIFSPPILGFIFFNGFWSAYWAFAILIQVNVLILTSIGDVPKYRTHIGLMCLILLSYQAWALITPTVLVLALIYFIRDRKVSLQLNDVILLVILLSHLSIGFISFNPAGRSLLEMIKLDGGIQNLDFVLVCTLFTFFMWLIMPVSGFRVYYIAQAILATLFYLLIGSIRLPNSFDGYYNIKLIWILFFSLVPVLVALFFKHFSSSPGKLAVGFLTGSLILNLSGVSTLSTISFISGRSGLNSDQVNTLKQLTSEDIAAFWYFTSPPTDRLATFWSSYATNLKGDTIVFNEVATWAYGQTGTEQDFCNLLKMQPKLRVITKFPEAVDIIVEKYCPEYLAKYSIYSPD